MDPLALLSLIARFAGLPDGDTLLRGAARSDACYSAKRARLETGGRGGRGAAGGRGGGPGGRGGRDIASRFPSKRPPHKPNSYSRISPDAAEMLAEVRRCCCR